MVVGMPIMKVEGAKGGEIIDLSGFDTMHENFAIDNSYRHHCKTSLSNRMICRPGDQKHDFFQISGIRYLLVRVRNNPDSEIRITPSLRWSAYPMKDEGKFSSSNPVANRIWEACKLTQKVCSLDAYVDTPMREQAQWWGDARVQAWNTFFISGDDNRCMDYASKIPDVDLARTLVIVILNDTKYAGTTNMYSNNFAIAYCPIVDGLSSDGFVGIILHEAVGHGFAKLADEYVYPEMGAIPQELVEQYSAQKLNGWWANADFTADPAAVSWASFISDSRYEAEGVSVYEGALTYTEGAYRPTLTSLMDQNVGDFNAPSRESIYKRVMELSGESYSRDKFLDYDAVNRTSAAVAARAAAARAIAGRRFTPLHPPVLKEFNR